VREPRGLQHADGFTQRGPADAEMRHELGLVREEVTLLELAVDHHAT
jgi:hypothetical protein